MGAELTITELMEPQRDRWQPLFDVAVKARDSRGSLDMAKALNGAMEALLLDPAVTTTEAEQVSALVVTLRENYALGATLDGFHDAAQAIVEYAYERMYARGYFRDSYNVSNVLWRLGLSWWRDLERYLLKDRRTLQGEALLAFRDLVAKADFTPLTSAEANAYFVWKRLPKAERDAMDEPRQWGEKRLTVKDVREWNEYFATKRTELLDFLDTAITAGLSIDCSV